MFLLGDDELIPVGADRYVLRSEGRFARIERLVVQGRLVWVVTDKDGTRQVYGRTAEARDGDGSRIVAWHLSEVCDRNNNRITYTYARDDEGHKAYLSQIAWGNGAFRVVCTYEARDDVLRAARSGVQILTTQRLVQLDVQVKKTSTGTFTTFDRFALTYGVSPLTGLSLLTEVVRTGFDAAGTSRTFPSLTLTYTQPSTALRTVQVTGHTQRAPSEPGVAFVDLDGSGVPDLLEVTSAGYVLRRNDGQGGFSRGLPITGPAARMGEDGVFLSDATGTGGPDLITPFGYYPNDDGTGFGGFQAFSALPAVSVEAQDTRWIDVNGDGVGDVIAVDVDGRSGLPCSTRAKASGLSSG